MVCEKVLLPFIWLIFWWKTRTWITRNESVWSISQLWNQTVTCRCFALKSRESKILGCSWHFMARNCTRTTQQYICFKARVELWGLRDIMIMSHRSWLTQSVKELLCLKVKKCSLKILVSGLRRWCLIKESMHEMKCSRLQLHLVPCLLTHCTSCYAYKLKFKATFTNSCHPAVCFFLHVVLFPWLRDSFGSFCYRVLVGFLQKDSWYF